MSTQENVEYKVLLVFPGFGSERENAEEVIEAALEYLNTQKDEPGMRFAYPVFARLEIVSDADQALTSLRNDDDLAMMILHALDDEEKAALTEEAVSNNVPVCHTVEAEPDQPKPPRPPRGERRILPVVFKERRPEDGPPAHRICETTLTAPLDDDPEDVGDRIGQLITVMALGVMEHHWRLNPPRYHLPE